MKILNFCPAAIVTGQGSLAYLKELEGRRVLVVCGGSSMERAGVLDRVQSYLEEGGREVAFFRGIRQDPTRQQIDEGVALMRQFQPDTVVAVGGGSSMDAAKAMMLFYEFPELNLDVIGKVPFPKVRKLKLVAIPSTSGTASEVTRTSVVTDPDKQLKIPVIDQILKPDVAILDADLPMTMPDHIAAETGMDAMAHAIECYTRHDLDDFDEVLARGAVEGILKWLPVSVLEKTPEAREKNAPLSVHGRHGFHQRGRHGGPRHLPCTGCHVSHSPWLGQRHFAALRSCFQSPGHRGSAAAGRYLPLLRRAGHRAGAGRSEVRTGYPRHAAGAGAG